MVLYLALMAGTVALKSQEAWLSQTGTDAQFAPEYSASGQIGDAAIVTMTGISKISLSLSTVPFLKKTTENNRRGKHCISPDYVIEDITDVEHILKYMIQHCKR